MALIADITSWILLETARDESRALHYHHAGCASLIDHAHAACDCGGPGDLLACSSMRRLIVTAHGYPVWGDDAAPWCRICCEPDDCLTGRVAMRWPCIAMRALLGSMTSRPGFRQVWLDAPLTPKAAAIMGTSVPTAPAPVPAAS